MTPPIRGGIYTKQETPAEDVSDSDTDADGANTTEDDCSGASSQSSLTSECSSIDAQKVQQIIAKRRNNGRAEPDVKSAASATTLMTASEFTDQCMQAEIDRDVSVYPSLNPLVQAEIIHKYRQLHQRVRDAGLYDCPFLEYGKEMARYTTLFTLFILALKCEWYMTSAVFLGLFWHQIMFTAHDAGRKYI